MRPSRLRRAWARFAFKFIGPWKRFRNRKVEGYEISGPAEFSMQVHDEWVYAGWLPYWEINAPVKTKPEPKHTAELSITLPWADPKTLDLFFNGSDKPSND